MNSEWKEYKFSEAVEINPQRSLKKGTIAPFIEMRAIEPNRRRPLTISRKKYSGGGAKFKNGDTLLARITPCLEHGKTVFVSDLKEEVGFGSTEFIVLTGKEGITDPLFVYYLCKYNEVRDFAIKSMTGSSGRQRVQEEAFNHLTIKIPPLTEQRKIAEILSSLDDKIELNYEMNKTLEAIAQAIFKNWFVDFEPFKDELVYNEELGKEVPEEWVIAEFGKIAKVTSGKRPELVFKTLSAEHNIPIYGGAGVMGYTDESLFDEKIIVTGRVGTLGLFYRVSHPSWPSDNTLVIIPRDNHVFNYCLFLLRTFGIERFNRGTSNPLVTQGDLQSRKVVLPPKELLLNFQNLTDSLLDMIDRNNQEGSILEQIRDALLPKLLSGEIRVKVDVEKEFPEEVKKLKEIEEEKVKLQGPLDKWLK
jgi:type I restriction enzyme S subunit